MMHNKEHPPLLEQKKTFPKLLGNNKKLVYLSSFHHEFAFPLSRQVITFFFIITILIMLIGSLNTEPLQTEEVKRIMKSLTRRLWFHFN